MRRLVSVVFVVVVMACGLAGAPGADEVATTRQPLDAVTGFGSNPGNLQMYRFVPPGLARGRPLVVLLHGCGETATSFSTSSGFEVQATQRQFALVLPQQQFINNVQTCFNWFDAANQQRDSGELLSIKQMVDRMVTDVGSDPQQVFIAGFSAGAAEVANVLATSPDRFRAGAIAAGVPFKCTGSALGSQGCLSGSSQTPQVWSVRVRDAFPTFTGTYPRVAVWQGQSDLFVAPTNGGELMKQWTAVHGIDQTADGTQPITSGGTRTFFRASAGGVALVELNEVPGLGHAWRSAWATDIADFFGLSAATSSDGGTAGGSAGGGAAAGGASGGGTAGGVAGGVAGGGLAGGGSAAAGGVGASGGMAGGNSAGGSAVAGGSAGGVATAGGSAGGGAVTQPMGCQSCNSAGGSLSLALVVLLRRRLRAPRPITADRVTPAP